MRWARVEVGEVEVDAVVAEEVVVEEVGGAELVVFERDERAVAWPCSRPAP